MKYIHEIGNRAMIQVIFGVFLLAAVPGTLATVYAAAGAPVYDLDGNGVLDEGDALVIKAAFGQCQGSAGYDARADYDGDNCVTFADYQQWYAAYKGQ